MRLGGDLEGNWIVVLEMALESRSGAANGAPVILLGNLLRSLRAA